MSVKRLFTPPFWIGAATALLILILGNSRLAQRIENHLFDAFTGWTARPDRWPDEIVLIVIDDKALQARGKYGERWPWPRSNHAAMAAYLHRACAKAVVFDVLFAEESEDSMHDDRFASYLKAAGNVWLAGEIHTDGPSAEPIAPLKNAVGSHIGFVNIEKDHDGVVRRYFLKDHWKHTNQKPLALALQEAVRMPSPERNPILLRWHVSLDEIARENHAFSAESVVRQGLKIVDAASTTKGLDELDPSQLAKWLAHVEVSKEAREVFGGKIVFIGCSGSGTFDAVATPLTAHEAGVMVHATALANLMRGDYLVETHPLLTWCMRLAVLMLVPWICVRLRGVLLQAGLTLILLLLGLGISWALFGMDLWLPSLLAVLGGLFSFTGITTYNYFVEGKQKRWLKQLFSDFVSPDVLAELQQSPHALKLSGDRRTGTVLFCDLVGFTTLSVLSTPEQFLNAINSYLSEASQALLKHEAYIDKFIGDAVMAVFGVPKPRPDHALKACLAALDLQDMMKGLNERLGRQYGITLGLRTGVNTGEMIAGPMGYARKLNYSVLGDTVNLASRLEGANKLFHTRIMIGPQTWEQAKEGVEARFLDLLRVKGEVRAFPVYELLGRKDSLSSEQRQLLEAYEKGIEHYRQRRWKEAIACFDRALLICKEDGPSQTYRERCEHYREHPPATDWDGSFSLDTK